MDCRLFGLAGLVMVAGCCGMCAETTPSENIRTEGLRELATVETSGEGTTRIAVTLTAGGALSNLYPTLGVADRLEARVGGRLVELVFDKGIIALPSYLADVPGDPAGKTFEILFTRSGNTSATGTRVTMPPGFAITSPAEGAHVSLSHPTVTLTWDPPSSQVMAWRLTGDCVVADNAGVLPDTGRVDLTLRPAPQDGGAPARGCDVKIIVERISNGVVDPAFGHGGEIRATQRRTRVVQLTP